MTVQKHHHQAVYIPSPLLVLLFYKIKMSLFSLLKIWKKIIFSISVIFSCISFSSRKCFCLLLLESEKLRVTLLTQKNFKDCRTDHNIQRTRYMLNFLYPIHPRTLMFPHSLMRIILLLFKLKTKNQKNLHSRV